MVASEMKCAHDGCDCIGTDEFCSDFCLAHGAGEHTHEHAEGGRLRLRPRGVRRRWDLSTPVKRRASDAPVAAGRQTIQGKAGASRHTGFWTRRAPRAAHGSVDAAQHPASAQGTARTPADVGAPPDNTCVEIQLLQPRVVMIARSAWLTLSCLAVVTRGARATAFDVEHHTRGTGS